MRQGSRILGCFAVLFYVFCQSFGLQAQDDLTIQVRVVDVYENSIYLDKGTADGIRPGDQVDLLDPSGGTIVAKVSSASRSNSRCIPVVGASSIAKGAAGSIAIGNPSSSSVSNAQWIESSISDHSLAQISLVDFEIAQDGPGAVRKIAVRVTASSGNSLYLDKGRASGLRPGDEVALFPNDDGIVNATVQSVSTNSARVTVLTTRQRIDIGTRGEVFIPTHRIAEKTSENVPARDAHTADHPPWTQKPEDWDQNQPLLAPAYSRPASKRESRIHGRLFSNYIHTWNRHTVHNQYSLGRIGASLWMDNPLGSGGDLRFRGEFNRRDLFLADDFDGADGPGRLDRISYSLGGTDDRPLRLEFGRFLSYEFPEFGVIDGTELVYRTAAGHRLGVSVGLLTEPFPNLEITSDLHVAVFFRWVADTEESLTSAIGFQKTWHRGTPDRDLLVWSADYNPNDHVSMHGTVWGDFYNSSDTLKSTPFEITEAIVQPILRFNPSCGLGAHVSFVRWPQLLRREYSPFVAQQIIGDHVVRWGLFSWNDLGPRTRVDGRVDQWNDESNGTGTSWEARLSLRDFVIDRSEVALAVFATDGIYSTGPGGRIRLSRQLPWCYASISYDIADYEIVEPAGGVVMGSNETQLVQQSVNTNLDFSLSSGKSVSVFADYRFGNSQDAVQAGAFFQQRL